MVYAKGNLFEWVVYGSWCYIACFGHFFPHACDFMTSSYLFHAEGWSTLKEICPKGWSMVKVFIMRVFCDFFLRACDLLTSCCLSFNGGRSKVKRIISCHTCLCILIVFFELSLCPRLSHLLPLSFLVLLVPPRYAKVLKFLF